MANDPNRRNDPDDTAAVPVTESKGGFNYLYLLPLLLLLLLIPFCRRTPPPADTAPTATPAATATPMATVTATATPVAALTPSLTDAARDTAGRAADATRSAAANTASAVTAAGAALLNPFTVNTTGPDMGKAVLNFDLNSTTPNAGAATILNSVAAYLKANPTARVTLTGYTDSTGTAEVNKRLAQQRIEAVKSALTSAGIDPTRIPTANFGSAYPVTDNSSPQAREMNRRVEVQLAK